MKLPIYWANRFTVTVRRHSLRRLPAGAVEYLLDIRTRGIQPGLTPAVEGKTSRRGVGGVRTDKRRSDLDKARRRRCGAVCEVQARVTRIVVDGYLSGP